MPGRASSGVFASQGEAEEQLMPFFIVVPKLLADVFVALELK